MPFDGRELRRRGALRGRTVSCWVRSKAFYARGRAHVLDEEDGLLIHIPRRPERPYRRMAGRAPDLDDDVGGVVQQRLSCRVDDRAHGNLFQRANSCCSGKLVERPRRPSHRYSTESLIASHGQLPDFPNGGCTVVPRRSGTVGAVARGIARDGPHLTGSSERERRGWRDERDYLIRELFASEQMLSSAVRPVATDTRSRRGHRHCFGRVSKPSKTRRPRSPI